MYTKRFLLAFALAVVLCDCKKDYSEKPLLTPDELSAGIAEMIAGPLVFAAYDISAFVTYTSGVGPVACSATLDSAFARHGDNAAFTGIQWGSQIHSTLSCAATPQSARVQADLGMTRTGAKYKSQGFGGADLTITGFGPDTGSYTATGNFTLNDSDNAFDKEFGINYDVQISELVITKGSHLITGGSGTLSLSAVTMTGVRFGYTASFAFDEQFGQSKSAVITIGTATYNVTLASGTVARQ